MYLHIIFVLEGKLDYNMKHHLHTKTRKITERQTNEIKISAHILLVLGV